MGVAAQDYQTRRGVAQPGSVLAWGASGRPFKSARPDQFRTVLPWVHHVRSFGAASEQLFLCLTRARASL